MAGLEQHAQHLAPQVLGLDGLEQLHLAAAGHGLVLLIALLEGFAVQVVQVGHIVGENSVHSPPSKTRFMNRSGIQLAVFMSWVRRRSSPVFLRSSDELLDIQVPGFQVGADRALAFAALVDRHRGIVDHLEEGYDALGFTVGALDIGPRARTGVQSLPRPPANLDSMALS